MTSIPVETPVEGRLDDGRAILFRPIRPADREGIRHALTEMSPESRYRRFFAPIDHLSEEQLDYLTVIDYQNHFAWLAMLPEAGDLHGVGVGRWIRLPEDPDVADAAVAVVDAYQNVGIGRALLRLMARSAIERGVRAFVATTLSENETMLRLFRDVGAVVEGHESGTVRVRVPLPASVEDLELTPSPRILRATAEGRLQGRSGARGVGVEFHTHHQREGPGHSG